LDLAIVDKSQNILVGEVVVNEYGEQNQSMNFRILIGPRGRDRGLGTEASQLIIEYVFKNTDLNFLTLSVFAFNPSLSATVYPQPQLSRVPCWCLSSSPPRSLW
jgi:diamine N-acetyltransferase